MLKKDHHVIYSDKCLADSNFAFTIQLPSSFKSNSIRNILRIWSNLCLGHSCVKCPIGRNNESMACFVNNEVRALIKQLRG